MALPRNLLCFLPDVNPSCSPCSVSSDVKCQLLSCHCEALQDSLVDSGVTCSGNGRRTWCLGELHCSGMAEHQSCLTKAGLAPPSSLSCTPVLGKDHCSWHLAAKSKFPYSPFPSSTNWNWNTLILHRSAFSARFFAPCIALFSGHTDLAYTRHLVAVMSVTAVFSHHPLIARRDHSSHVTHKDSAAET